MIHINVDPYDLKSPAACGSYGEGEAVISMRIASHVVEGRITLSKISEDDLCPDCLHITDYMLFEIGRSFRNEVDAQPAASAARHERQ